MSMIKKRNIFRITLWLFVLIFLMIFSGVSIAQEAAKDSEYLQKITLCKDILDKNPVRGANFFFPQDEKVVTWLRFSYDSAEKFLIKWEWITPQGKLYHQGEMEMETGSYTNYRTWYWIKIKGNYASQLPGEWKVRAYINDIFLAERNFFVEGYIGLSNPEKVIEFEDKAFESAIRDCFDLDDGDITWRDIGYRTALDSDDFQPKGRINTLEDLKWFVNLQKIEMQEYEVEGDLSSFSHMENLEVLLMWETDVSGDLSSLSGLENLRAINLSHTDVVGDLSSLSGLETIEEIELVGTAVKGDVSCFDGHENLEVLELEDTYVTGR